MIKKEYERVGERLLRDMHRGKPIGALFEGKWYRGVSSTHKSRQAVRWRMFLRIKKYQGLHG